MKNRLLHMIGNAHIDPVWLWRWQEGFHEVLATFRAALDYLQEYPAFTFVASSAVFYEWVEKSRPEMFAEIRARVQEGRWIIVGGMWIEPDCNLPCGESFVRQVLYAQRFFLSKLGRLCQAGYNIDSFGHHANLPQILLKGGMPAYIFMRPMEHEKSLPGRLFWWEASDGSRVLTFRLPFSYLCDDQSLPVHARRCAEEMTAPMDESMCFYGIGDHGGGPTRKSIELILQMDRDPAFPARLVFGNPDVFFEQVKAKGWEFPVVQDELQHHASGCYAAHSGVKRWNRRAENRLLAAEKWACLAAWLTGQAYPDELGRAWKNVLFNQFHDILAGTSLESAYEDVRDSYGEACAIADRALNLAMQAIAWQIHIPLEEATRPIIVFNPLTWPMMQPVELDFDRWQAGAVLLDENNTEIPYQAEDSPTTPWRSKLIFLADLPALGYKTYRFSSRPAQPVESGQDMDEETAGECQAGGEAELRLENRRFTLTISAANGLSLLNKEWNCQVFSGPAAVPVAVEDPSDTWSHGILRFDQEMDLPAQVSLRRLAHGPVRQTVCLAHRLGNSQVKQYFSLYPQADWVEVKVTVDWHEKHRLLKLRFPLNIRSGCVTCEIPYGAIRRPADGEEEPMQNWVDVSGEEPGEGRKVGLSLLNDGKYSVDVRTDPGGTPNIGLTVLRSPVYAHHDPAVLDPEGEYRYMDQGFQQFRYLLLPHAGSWEEARTVQRAMELNQPAMAMVGTHHPQGMWPQSDHFIEVTPANVLVNVVKKAEDGQAWILRAVEVNGWDASCVINLPVLARRIEAYFKPGEIKTFYIPLHPGQPLKETDLLEIA
jgi:alpha-mannosidase